MMTLTRNNFPFFIILLICAATLGSCDESETVIPKGRPITFTTEDNRGDAQPQSRTIRTTSGNGDIIVDVTVEDDECSATRLTEDSEGDVSFAVGESFGVFAYCKETEDGPEKLLMDNVKVTYTGNSWECSKTVYWPLKSPGTKITFYAYYPYDETLKDGEKTSTTLTLAAGAKPNMMWTKKICESDDNEYNSPVALTFKQKMARVSFEVINLPKEIDRVYKSEIKLVVDEDASETLDVKDGDASETLDVKDGDASVTLDVKSGVLTSTNTDKTSLIVETKEGDKTSNFLPVGRRNLMISGDGGGKDIYIVPGKYKISFDYNNGGQTSQTEEPLNELEAGKKYHYKIMFADVEDNHGGGLLETLNIHNEPVLKEILDNNYQDCFCIYVLQRDMDFGKEKLAPSKLFARSCYVEFNGNDKSILNFQIKGSIDGSEENKYAGLFSESKEALGSLDGCNKTGHVIKNLTISNFSVTVGGNVNERLYAGGLIGYADETTIENCRINCRKNENDGYRVIDINVHDEDEKYNMYVGGVVGYLNNSNIVGCIATNYEMCAVGSSGVWCGGLVGAAENSAIYICGVAGVEVSASAKVEMYCGGCVGGYSGSIYGFCWCNYCYEISFEDGVTGGDDLCVGGFAGGIYEVYPNDVTQIFKCNFWIDSKITEGDKAVGNDDGSDDIYGPVGTPDTPSYDQLKEVITVGGIDEEGIEISKAGGESFAGVAEALNGAYGIIRHSDVDVIKKFPWMWESNEGNDKSNVPLVPKLRPVSSDTE